MMTCYEFIPVALELKNMLQALFNLYVFSLSCSVITAVFTYTAVKQNNARKNFSESIISSNNDPRIVGVSLPIVINTWPFIEAGERAWEVLSGGGSALDAVEQGCSKCEELQCDGTVGYGGSPDENGETTLDAMIMDGETHSIGAVGALRRVKNAITVARYIMEHTKHTLLVGSQATDFALMMGFPEHNLTTSKSESLHISWKQDHCQPNFWKNVVPDPKTSCGPYFPASNANVLSEMDEIEMSHVSMKNHDTIGMIAIDSMGRVAAGTSTNGARNKIPGRVGDSPIPGSGAYVDKNVGASAATGDGDVMMRFMPSLIAVEGMRHGLTPDAASTSALQRIIDFYPAFSGAVVALNIQGQFGAACFNLPEGYFNYTVGYPDEGVHLESVSCMNATVVSNLLIFE